MELTEAIAFLRKYNSWRRCDDDGIDQPHPSQIGHAIDAICDHAERLERELDQMRKWTTVNGVAAMERELSERREWSSKLADVADDMRADLAAERALADRLANVLLIYDADTLAGETMQWIPAHAESLSAWKEARK